jgi:hypothetical protein
MLTRIVERLDALELRLGKPEEAQEETNSNEKQTETNRFAALEAEDDEEEMNEAQVTVETSSTVQVVMEQKGEEEKRKKDVYRGYLPQVSAEGKDEASQTLQLIVHIEQHRDDYTEKCLRLALRSRLRGTTARTIDPRGSLSLDELIRELRSRFSSPKRLDEDIGKIVRFKFRRGADRVEETQRYTDLVRLVNAECIEADLEQKMWNMDRTMDHLINHILEAGSFRDELGRLWRQVSSEKFTGIAHERIREMAASADAHAMMNEGHKEAPRLNILKNGNLGQTISYPITCWRCGQKTTSTKGKSDCQCSEKPKCAECKGLHRTEFHQEVMKRRSANSKNQSTIGERSG